MAAIEEVLARARLALVPPPRLVLSDWIERHVLLPDGVSAQPGPVRLWPFQREIADAIGDPLVERVTVVKSVRVGYTTLLTGAIGGFVVNDPAPILALLPTEADVVDFLRAQQREVAAGVGLLYEQLTGDLSATNYSSARFGLLEHRRRLRLLQRTVLVDQLLAPLWRRFVELAEHNRWVPPGTAAGPAPRWVLPGFEATDPEKEVRADALAVENRFKSRVEVIESRGLDIDELDAEIAADRFRPPAAARAVTAAPPAEETAP